MPEVPNAGFEHRGINFLGTRTAARTSLLSDAPICPRSYQIKRDCQYSEQSMHCTPCRSFSFGFQTITLLGELQKWRRVLKVASKPIKMVT